jgi:hypothetical protein
MFVNTSGNWVYTKTNSASRYEQENGVHKWYSYASGNANATVTGGAGNSMTLNASGNLNIGSGNITGVSGYASTLAISGTSNTTATASGIQLGDNYNTNSLQWGIYNGYGTTGSETGTLCIVVSNAANTNPLSNGTTALRINRSGNLQVPAMYNQTSAAAANVVVGTGGDLYRSTSALKYKQDIRDLESVDLTKFRPVRYKSKCETDDQTKDHIGFIADSYVNTYPELVAFGAGGEVEGFAYERMTAVLCKVIQQQQNMIQELADRISALENK